MADQTKGGIAWTDQTYNPIRGCSMVSAGCTNCYAMLVAHRFGGKGQPYEGLTTNGKWNGKIRVVEDRLLDPLRWKRPRRVFVNSMSDLFHENLPTAEIDKIFAVMALSPRHTFQVLTKRPERMRAYLNDLTVRNRVLGLAWMMLGKLPKYDHGDLCNRAWPLANVWLGVSAEDDVTWRQRVPELQATPAAIRWVSVEPQIGPIFPTPEDAKGLSWIVFGGESGSHDVRPFHVSWATLWIEWCRFHGLYPFLKQLGSVPVVRAARLRHYEWSADEKDITFSHYLNDQSGLWHVHTVDRKGGDPAEWPEHLRVREFPDGATKAA